jgi:Putative lumazine-binding
MAATAQETEQITHAINLYVEGVRDGDAAKLREAFHPDARMWGSMAGERYDEPIAEMIAMVDGKPVDVDGSYQTQITSMEQNDDVASAVLAEEGFWGTVSFVDFFALARIDGAWKIVNKTFVHTGGEPPAAE